MNVSGGSWLKHLLIVRVISLIFQKYTNQSHHIKYQSHQLTLTSNQRLAGCHGTTGRQSQSSVATFRRQQCQDMEKRWKNLEVPQFWLLKSPVLFWGPETGDRFLALQKMLDTTKKNSLSISPSCHANSKLSSGYDRWTFPKLVLKSYHFGFIQRCESMVLPKENVTFDGTLW